MCSCPPLGANWDKCQNSPANLTPMFWSCSALVNYWSTIFKTFSDVLHVTSQPSAEAAIWGVSHQNPHPLRNSHKDVLAFATLIARILLHWKSKDSSTVSLWPTDPTQLLQLQNLKYSASGPRDTFSQSGVLTFYHHIPSVYSLK